MDTLIADVRHQNNEDFFHRNPSVKSASVVMPTWYRSEILTDFLKLIFVMVKEFYYKGHHYNVVNAEGGEDYFIVKDGKTTRKVNKEIAQRAIEYVDKLFK